MSVGSFPTRAEAKALAVRLCTADPSAGVLYSSEITSLNPGYRVAHSNPFPTQDAAGQRADRLQALGFAGAEPRWIAPLRP